MWSLYQIISHIVTHWISWPSVHATVLKISIKQSCCCGAIQYLSINKYALYICLPTSTNTGVCSPFPGLFPPSLQSIVYGDLNKDFLPFSPWFWKEVGKCSHSSLIKNLGLCMDHVTQVTDVDGFTPLNGQILSFFPLPFLFFAIQSVSRKWKNFFCQLTIHFLFL